jgi:DNA-binding LacI/PurR family transcriptional regulator
MRALLALRERPTAVFCANDLLALGALKQALTSGLFVPGDVSVMGCDDIEMAHLVSPELTTIAMPARELGARGARLLLSHIEHRDAVDDAVLAARRALARPLDARLVVRGSTAPLALAC